MRPELVSVHDSPDVSSRNSVSVGGSKQADEINVTLLTECLLRSKLHRKTEQAAVDRKPGTGRDLEQDQARFKEGVLANTNLDTKTFIDCYPHLHSLLDKTTLDKCCIMGRF